MIRNHIIFRDYETGSKNKYTCQPLQLAAVAIDLQRLEIIQDSVFDSLIKPELDEDKCKKLGIAPIEEEALRVNKLDLEELKKAPDAKLVWQRYLDYLKDYNLKGKTGGKWDAPIVAGYNGTNFDDFIDIRMCEQYGPKLDEWGGWSIYHPFIKMDGQMMVQDMFFSVNITKNGSVSMDAMREYFGYKTEGAHNARVDVLQGADLLIRFLRLNKELVNGNLDLPKGKKIKFKNCVGGKI